MKALKVMTGMSSLSDKMNNAGGITRTELFIDMAEVYIKHCFGEQEAKGFVDYYREAYDRVYGEFDSSHVTRDDEPEVS